MAARFVAKFNHWTFCFNLIFFIQYDIFYLFLAIFFIDLMQYF